jgi:hypothetical protein
MTHILSSVITSHKQNCLFAVKLYAKCKKLALQKPYNLIVAPVIKQLMTKSLILMRNAWKKYEKFVSLSKKCYQVKVLRQSQALTNSLSRPLRKVFSSVIDCLELNEFVKNQKNHFAEQIFSFLARKRHEMRRQGLFCIKKFVQSVRIVKKKLWRLLELTEKSVKLNFIESLVHNHLIKMKIYKTITQIIDYSSAQSSRVRMLKLFHTWKRNLVSIKIAIISQKYARSIRNKKMAERLMQVTRKSYKLGMLSLKSYIRPHFNRFKVIFITNSLSLILNSSIKNVFSLVRSHNKSAFKMKDLLSPMLAIRFFSVITGIKQFIIRRRTIVLLKLLTGLSTRIANQTLLMQFRGFSRLAEFGSYHSSPSHSIVNESPKLSPTMKLSLQSTCSSNTKRKLLVKERASAGSSNLEKKPNKKRTPPPRRAKNSTPNKRKSLRIISKAGSSKLQKHSTMTEQDEVNNSFISNFTELSPKSAIDFPKKFVQWEEKIMVLAVAMVNSLLKSFLKAYFKDIIEA